MKIYIIGLPSSGKTTLGKELYEKLKMISDKYFTLFDGEDLRKKLWSLFI